MEQKDGRSSQRIPSKIHSRKANPNQQKGLILPLELNAGGNLINETFSSRRSSSQRVNPLSAMLKQTSLEQTAQSSRELQIPSFSRVIPAKSLGQHQQRSFSSVREHEKKNVSQREHENVELNQEKSQQMVESRKVVEGLKQKMGHVVMMMEGERGNRLENVGDRRKDKAEKIKRDMEGTMEGNKLEEYFQNYQVMAKDVISKERLLASPNLRVKQYKNSIYFGEVQNGNKTGKGIMIYNSGRVFEGEWQNDAKFGMGFELYPNGNAFLGFFVNGKPEGQGTYLWSNGEIYDGEWVNGMKHGNGQWMGIKGDSYTGEWKFGKPDGYGTHRWVNGDIYCGEFKNCLKHGQGKEYFENGDVYIGQYSNGRPEGVGQYLWSDGAFYEGSFKNGLRHGQGKWRSKQEGEAGDTYEGEYLNDKRCGQGIFRWASGNTYKGQYFDDMRHGYGEIYWTDSSYYKGDWENGVQCGSGELYSVGQRVRKGIFQNNIFKEIKDTNNPIGNGSFHGSSNSKLFRTVSEEMQTPRGIQQGQSGKRTFMPQTPELSEEGSVIMTLTHSKYYQDNSNTNGRRYASNPNSTRNIMPTPFSEQETAPIRELAQKLPSVDSKRRTSKVQIGNGNKMRNSQASKMGENRKKISVVSANGGQKQKLPNIQKEAKTLDTINNYQTYGQVDDTTQTIVDGRQQGNLSFQNEGQSLSGGSGSEAGNGKIRRSISLQGNPVTSSVKPIKISKTTKRQTRAISLLPNEKQSDSQDIQLEEYQQQGQQLLPTLGQQLVQKSKRRSSPKKNKVILLRKDERILWKIRKQKLLLKPKDLRDLTDQKTVDIIRNLLHPPLWKPSGVQHSLQTSPRQTATTFHNSLGINSATVSSSPQQSQRLR